MKNLILSGILGLSIGDALGVPAEFRERKSLHLNPINGMTGYGAYHMPPGTWSDDTSLSLCLLDSLSKGLDYADMMEKFLLWRKDGEYTPFGEVFDIGRTCACAIDNYQAGLDPLACGLSDEQDNGNGALMRILPAAFYIYAKYGKGLFKNQHAIDIVHNISRLTHAHKRSMIACGIYVETALSIIDCDDLEKAIQQGIANAFHYYGQNSAYVLESQYFQRITNHGFYRLPEQYINSSGYVVDTLEAAIWCLLNTGSYKDCILKAVNLGGDTDTVAAVAGGLAGIFYGADGIPADWAENLVKKDYIEALCHNLYISLVQEHCEDLFRHIPYLTKAEKEGCCYWEKNNLSGAFNFSYPVYQPELLDFIACFCKSALFAQDYENILDQNAVSEESNLGEVLIHGDIELVSALLTAFVIEGKANEGLWEKLVENGIFLKGLERLKQLIK